jgi:hypothetical protein
MWCSWRAFSAWMAAHSSGSTLARVEYGTVGRAHVVAQAAFQAAGAGDALLEHLHAHAQVGHRGRRPRAAAEGLVLVVVHAGHHLHQALGADRALGKRVEAGLHGHDGQDQGRVQPGALADGPGLLHQAADRLGGDLVAARDPVATAACWRGSSADRRRWRGPRPSGSASATSRLPSRSARASWRSCSQPRVVSSIRAGRRAGRPRTWPPPPPPGPAGPAVVADFEQAIAHIAQEHADMTIRSTSRNSALVTRVLSGHRSTPAPQAPEGSTVIMGREGSLAGSVPGSPCSCRRHGLTLVSLSGNGRILESPLITSQEYL